MTMLCLALAFAFSGSGAGSAGDPYVITNCTQLQEIEDEVDAHYALGNSINCAATGDESSIWDAEGFDPIVNFAATFDGRNFTVSNIFINKTGVNNVGPFGSVVNNFDIVLKDVGMTSVTVIGRDYVGGLLGYGPIPPQSLTLDNVYTTGTVTGRYHIGGLIGGVYYYTDIVNSYSTADVDGVHEVGGLVGLSGYVTITNSSTTGAITGSSHTVGGVAGYCYMCTFTNISASGAVTSQGDRVGGLLGYLGAGTITNSIASATVQGANKVGGLIGEGACNGCTPGSNIARSYFTGSVNGTNYIGGIIGYGGETNIDNVYNTGTVRGTLAVGGIGGWLWYSDYGGGGFDNAYNTGSVTGTNDVGGLIGQAGYTDIDDSYSSGTVTGINNVGQLIGNNSPWGSSESTTTTSYWHNASDDATNCVGDDPISGCQSNMVASDYHKGAVSSKAPFSAWDFTGVWYERASGPGLRAFLASLVPTPTLSSSISVSSSSVAQNATFTLTATISCSQANCNSVVIQVDPLQTSAGLALLQQFLLALLTSAIFVAGVYTKRRGQTATEYLIITAVVIIIALIVVGTLGGIPGIGGSVDKQANDAKLKTQDVAVISYSITETGLTMKVQNNKPNNIRITAIKAGGTSLVSANIPKTLGPGEAATISSSSLSSFTGGSDETGNRYELTFTITYTDLNTQGQYTIGNNSAIYLVGDYSSGGSGVTYKGILDNTSSPGEAFYIQGEPATFDCATIDVGSSCEKTFTINASGSPGDYIFYTIATSSNAATSESNRLTVTIS
jgi:hypothetical protein